MPYSHAERESLRTISDASRRSREGTHALNDHARTSHRHFLLPFEAVPETVGQLRHMAGLQLATWGAAHLTDAVTLAVSELATNVIRHVGEGAPAALVMETRDDVIRLELHDTGAAMPHAQHSGPEDLQGRGLALVSAVSAGWSATPTPTGKAVCCEFPRSPQAAAAALIAPHVTRGSSFLDLYAVERRLSGQPPLRSRAALEATAVDLIADVLHSLAAAGRDPDAVLDHAQTRFENAAESE
jgi:anti-sigma regulatory factor (Ser/Thr protein kinase)